MNTSLSKNFEPLLVEDKWYRHWLNKGYFNSTPDNRKPFTIVIPPPNVTGVLHMGHTLNETVQDVLVRKARMSGYNACWVPGSDHASIATEAKVVQFLEKEKGIKKQDLSRENFLKHAFDWKEKYGDIIYYQIKKLGCSVDWNRVTFTMDDHYYRAVIKVFIDLYNKGMIYRGARMINWDPVAKTALSDEEVEHRDVQGKLYYVKYFIKDDSGQKEDDNWQMTNDSLATHKRSPNTNNSEETDDKSDLTTNYQLPTINDQQPTTNYIIIATQRPETIMGDTGICVNPADERYRHLKGKKIIVPLVNREVSIIFDEYVDPSFGTGALKLTPAHDINDYNIGLKHNLPIVDTLNDDGTLSEAAEVFVGLDRFEARKKVIEKLREENLIVKEEDYNTRLGFSQRTNAVVEPRISTQWFVKMRELSDEALTAVVNGDVKIHPEERFLATYKYWLENVKDWCISRQLWWGQRIPAWYDSEGRYVVAETEEEAFALFQRQRAMGNGQSSQSIHHSPFTIHDLVQDEDVLDTWFSSWLWPMEVFKGISEPNNPEINYYYPTSVLVTGQDIIFFWVARMIMAGMEYKQQKPFEHVYFTGMVRDKLGRKMSKSLGNSPDLLELIEKFGADAVRFGILIAAPAGNDLLFDDNSCEQGRHFNNKLWNALKLVRIWKGSVDSSQLTDDSLLTPHSSLTTQHFAIQWFENRLSEVKIQVEKLYEEFKLSEALKKIYSLVWDDFCSWYLEWIKPGFEQPMEANVYKKTVSFFEDLVQLLHPFMPFVTEEIYHELREQKDDLCIRQFVTNPISNESVLKQAELLKQTITSIRDAKTKNNIKPREVIELSIQTNNQDTYKSFETILSRQVNAGKISFVTGAINNSISVVTGKDKLYIETGNSIDTTTQKATMLKDLAYLKGFLVSVDKKLSNERFMQNAKPEVVDIERRKKNDAEEKIRAITESLAGLE
jgi:valyl-tRNA synthetase